MFARSVGPGASIVCGRTGYTSRALQNGEPSPEASACRSSDEFGPITLRRNNSSHRSAYCYAFYGLFKLFCLFLLQLLANLSSFSSRLFLFYFLFSFFIFVPLLLPILLYTYTYPSYSFWYFLYYSLSYYKSSRCIIYLFTL